MKVFNESKTTELNDYDLEKGYLIDDLIIIKTEEVPAVQEQSHTELIKEYKDNNGDLIGKDYKIVIDVLGRCAIPAKEESEIIQVYVPYTSEELKQRVIENQSIDKSVTHSLQDLLIDLENLSNWFKDYYKQIIEYYRCQNTGKLYDRNIQELDTIAEIKTAEVKNLRAQIERECK